MHVIETMAIVNSCAYQGQITVINALQCFDEAP